MGCSPPVVIRPILLATNCVNRRSVGAHRDPIRPVPLARENSVMPLDVLRSPPQG